MMATGYSGEAWNTKEFFERANVADTLRYLQDGADVNARDERGWTPLHRAAAFSKTPAVLAALLRNGADPNARDTDGVTPLHEAALSVTLGVLTALVPAGACPNTEDKNGLTPLHAAAARSKTTGVVPTLAQAGADPRAQDKNDWTPLHRAARDENDETPWDHVRMDSPLRGTDVFWRLKDERRP